ncbi:response regulator [Methanoregula sp. UBA64]|jgi:PAS domain S-box-containing protein|uniref:hybrid sensor histidine kinase/response regulator n=1 Tax=Methanoregula sp. UBA64 TaxID=1915554 RepID=UPI0025F08F5C|nr:response regulator [Methanoregula sp. UBA64]
MIRTLVVDDEPALLELSKTFLEKSGEISVDLADSALSALDRMKSASYDVIVSDYEMPGMDGILFLKKLRESGRKTPFILFTGKGREEIVIEALNSGATFYLQKGMDTKTQYAELISKIRIADLQFRAEKSVQDSRQQMETILSFLPDPTLAIDNSGNLILWNHAARELTGIAAADMLGKGGYIYAVPFYGKPRPLLVDLILHPDEQSLTRYTVLENSATCLMAECGVDLPDGRHRVFWGKATPLYNPDGEISGAIEIFHDITEQKRIIDEHKLARESLARKNEEILSHNKKLAATEEVLSRTLDELRQSHRLIQESEQKYRILVDTLPDALLIHDGEKIVYGNPAACAMFGVDQHSLVRIPLASLLGNGAGKTIAALSGAAAGGASPALPLEFSVKKPGGETVWLETTVSSLGNDRQARVQLFFHDITKRKLSEDHAASKHNEAERYAHALDRANKNLNLLYSITRHDILNQLTVLTGFMELSEAGITDPVLKEYFKKQKCAAQAIYRSILFTRDYQALGIHEPVWQNLQDLICCVTAQATAPGIRFTIAAEGLEVYADPLFEKTFYNLIDNSLRHGHQVSAITISARKDDSGVTLVYEDNGAGVPRDEKARIFERGYGKNTGLGLYLVQEILALTDISIKETGEPGHGARFEMQIPERSYRLTTVPARKSSAGESSPLLPP